MITKAQIDELISKIPPIPALLKASQAQIEAGDLAQAAKIASDDLAFVAYIKALINSPAYGLKGDIKDINQIFSLLGANELLNLIKSYMVLLTAPKKWQIFAIDNLKFANLQASFLSDWAKLLKFLQIEDREIFRTITIIPASLSLCDKIFSEHTDVLKLVLQNGGVSYNEILKNDLNSDIFAILSTIAQKWDLSQKTIDIIKNLESSDDEISNYITLLTSYELSRAEYANTGFEEIFEFGSRATKEQIEIFMKAISYEN